MAPNLSSIVGAYEAKTHFSKLLERVEAGEELTITRHGTPVAHLVPIQQRPTAQQRRAAIEAIHQLAGTNKLNGLKVRDLLAEGRR
jgi:prevent-host-death family protein